VTLVMASPRVAAEIVTECWLSADRCKTPVNSKIVSFSVCLATRGLTGRDGSDVGLKDVLGAACDHEARVVAQVPAQIGMAVVAVAALHPQGQVQHKADLVDDEAFGRGDYMRATPTMAY
jgi:hypothetical protein